MAELPGETGPDEHPAASPAGAARSDDGAAACRSPSVFSSDGRFDGAGSGGAGGPAAATSSASPQPAPVAAAAPGTLAAKTRLEDALAKVAGASVPSTDQMDQIRAALADAGFPPGTIEVTASRTPTGLATDAVEAALRQHQDRFVAQLRAGALAVAVLPAPAGGRCLAGSPA